MKTPPTGPSSEPPELGSLRAHLLRRERIPFEDLPIPRGYALIELTRAIDLFLLAARNAEADVRDALVLRYSHGWPRTLGLFLDESCKGRGIPLTPSSETSIQWASSVIQHFGGIALCESILEQHRTGLVVFKGAEAGRYRFAYVDGAIGLEAIEADDWKWIQQFTFEAQKEDRRPLAAAKGAIQAQMAALVAPWFEHYIQYDTNPEIDLHYHQEGLLRAELLTGHDAFDGESPFGGIPFHLYRSIMGTLIGLILKHLGFCQILMNKHPTLRSPNLITITADTPRLVEALSLALGEDARRVGQVLTTFVLSADNCEAHVLPDAAPPPLIRIGDERVIKSVAGHLANPFHFMLRELRRRYPGDWDRAVDRREERFRFEVYALFSAWPQIVVRWRPLDVRRGGNVLTDIDALLYDQRRRVLGLVQLKWQDPFASMRERASKKENFLNTGNKWVTTISDWLKERGPKGVARDVGIPDAEAERIERIVLFVFGRHFAHFSATTEPHAGAAWGNWAQVVRLVHASEARPDDPIGWLDESLRRDSPFRRVKRPEAAQELDLGEGVFVTIEP